MINIEIDVLTNSVQDRLTGEIFQTDILEVSLYEITMLEGWNFDWQKEFSQFQVYKIVPRNKPVTIQGLISLKVKKALFMLPFA